MDRGYQTILGRNPDAAGRTYWVGRLATEKSYVELLASLGSSAEAYQLGGGTNSGFVTYLFDRLLNRAPDAGGLTYWTGRLDAGTPRGTLVRTLASLSEPMTVLSTKAHQEMLDRDPTPTELAASLARLQATGDLAAEYSALIATQAFYDRAQTLPNP